MKLIYDPMEGELFNNIEAYLGSVILDREHDNIDSGLNNQQETNKN